MVVMAEQSSWIDRAACRGEHWVNWDGPHVERAAAEMCGGCPVRVSCLKSALARPRELDYGILAATTAHERELMRRRKLDPRAVWARQGFPYRGRSDDDGE